MAGFRPYPFIVPWTSSQTVVGSALVFSGDTVRTRVPIHVKAIESVCG